MNLMCDKSIANDCNGGPTSTITAICAVCEPIASPIAHRPLSCEHANANAAVRKFPDLSIIHTSRDEIRQDQCAKSADSFKCTYTISCGAQAYQTLIGTDAVAAEIMNMGKQDPVHGKSDFTFTSHPKQWRHIFMDNHIADLSNIGHQGKNKWKYDFIILSTNPRQIRYSNQVVGHTSMMTGDEYEAAKAKQLKVIWAGSFTVQKGAEAPHNWELDEWENDSGHFLPRPGVGNINAKRFADYWGMPMAKFHATANADAYFEQRRQQGVVSSEQRKRQLKKQLANKKKGRVLSPMFRSSQRRPMPGMGLRHGGKIGGPSFKPKPPNPDDPHGAHILPQNAYDSNSEDEEIAHVEKEEVISSPVNQYYSIKTDKGSDSDSGNNNNAFTAILVLLVVIIACFACLFTGIIGILIGRSMSKSYINTNHTMHVAEYQKMDQVDDEC